MRVKRDYSFLIRKYVLRRQSTNPLRFEHAVEKFLKGTHGNWFIDIGAHEGEYCLILRKNFSKILAIEPNPTTASVLDRRLRQERIQNVEVIPIAFGDKASETKLFIDQLAKGSGPANTVLPVFDYRPSTSPFEDTVLRGKNAITVRMDTFDNFVGEKLRWQEVDLVKIDVEGAEFLVLQGMEEHLRRKKIKCLVVELHDRTRRMELESIFRYHFSTISWIDANHLLGRAGHP